MPTPDFILRLREHVGHELLWLMGATAVVLDADERVLLVRRVESGEWTPVMGIVEPGEHPATTAVREALEEAGVVVEVEALVRVHVLPPRTLANGDRTQFLDHVLRCRYVAGEAHVADDESSDVGWFALTSLPPMRETMAERIRAAVAFDGTVDLGGTAVVAQRPRGDVATIPRDHYRQLLLAAGQDLAEASATEIVATGGYRGPGPSMAMLVADAYAIEPDAATELVDAYLDALRHHCAERGVAAPSLDTVLTGLAASHHPRFHAPIDVDALVAHLHATVAPQIIAFAARHRAAVLDGSKAVTVRWREPIAPGPATLTFDGSDEQVSAHVRSVTRIAIADLTPAAVHAPERTDMLDYVDLLRSRYYPRMPDDAVLDVVELRIVGRDDEGRERD